jgi:prevent-host-death family protein
MTKTVTTAEAKSHLSALVAAVSSAGEHVIIQRRGKPVAALVSVEDLQRLDADVEEPSAPVNFLSLAGAWSDVGDEKIDALMDEIYAERERDQGRSVELEP